MSADTEIIRTLAAQLLAQFERATRADGTQFWRLREGRPDWMQEAIRAAHSDGQILPDDYRYAFAREALIAIDSNPDTNAEELEEEIQADSYTNDLTQWLASGPARVTYLDEALDTADQRAFALLQQAQWLEKVEVLRLLYHWLYGCARTLQADT